MPQEYARFLAEATEFRFNGEDGAFESMIVDEQMPQWCLNFKKALIAMIQTKLPSTLSSVESNQVNGSVYVLTCSRLSMRLMYLHEASFFTL